MMGAMRDIIYRAHASNAASRRQFHKMPTSRVSRTKVLFRHSCRHAMAGRTCYIDIASFTASAKTMRRLPPR